MRQKRAIIFEKLQNVIQNENNSHLVTYESAGFGGFYIKKRHTSKGLPGIRVARPGPIFSSLDRDGPDFFQPDRARDLEPDPGPIGIGISRFSPIFKRKIFDL